MPSWFPDRKHPGAGIFILKHAQEIARHCNVCVLFFSLNPGNRQGQGRAEVDSGTYENITVITIHGTAKRGLIGNILNLIFINYHFFKEAFLKKRFRYDLIHLHVVYHIGLYLFHWLALSGLPIVITEHWTGYYAKDGRFNNLNHFSKKIIGNIFKKSAAVTTVSETLGRRLNQLFSTGDRTTVVRNVLDFKNDAFQGMEKDKNVFRFLVIANLDDRQKNIRGIIEGFNALRRKSSANVQLVIAGSGNDFEMLSSFARETGNTEATINFTGYVPNDLLQKYYSAAHCYVMNSNFETFSISTAEALINGLPVISTRCGGPEEYVNEKNGILIEAGNTAALESAMSAIMLNYQKFVPGEIRHYANELFRNISGQEFYSIYKKVIK